MNQTKVAMVPLSKIDPPEGAQRDSIDPIKIIELAESIREKGLINPILVRPVNGRFEIVAGHRRFLAHQHLRLKEIAVTVKELDDVGVILYRAIENLQRENLSPMEEARAYNLMKVKGGLSTNEIVRQTGKHKETIIRYLRLYEMPPEFQGAVDKRSVSIQVAEKLMEIEDPQMRLYYLGMASENGITIRVAEMWVSDFKKSLQGTLFEDMGGDVGSAVPAESKPSYVACDCCRGAVDIRNARSIVVCVDCLNAVRGSRVGKV
jgi:ParB family chromosome partitioning protein